MISTVLAEIIYLRLSVEYKNPHHVAMTGVYAVLNTEEMFIFL